MNYVQLDLAHIERDTSPIFDQPRIGDLANERTSVKLIFLDVDGVLNSSAERLATSINEKCLQRFCHMVHETDAHIVVSSTWRKHKPFMEKLLFSLDNNANGTPVAHRVLGKTVEIAPFERPAEILQWIRDFKKGFPSIQVTDWIAVDDMPLANMHPKMQGHCVLTTIQAGFLNKHIAESFGKIGHRDSPVSVMDR